MDKDIPLESVKHLVRHFVVDNFLFGDDNQLEDHTSFLDKGIIDSMGVLELVDFIDKTFQVTIADSELLPENLDSINNIEKYLQRKLAPEDTPLKSGSLG